jgi:hypothetical protein
LIKKRQLNETTIPVDFIKPVSKQLKKNAKDVPLFKQYTEPPRVVEESPSVLHQKSIHNTMMFNSLAPKDDNYPNFVRNMHHHNSFHFQKMHDFMIDTKLNTETPPNQQTMMPYGNLTIQQPPMPMTPNLKCKEKLVGLGQYGELTLKNESKRYSVMSNQSSGSGKNKNFWDGSADDFKGILYCDELDK